MFEKLKQLCKNLNCKSKCMSENVNEYNINNQTFVVSGGITLRKKDTMRISKILDKYDLEDLMKKYPEIKSSII